MIWNTFFFDTCSYLQNGMAERNNETGRIELKKNYVSKQHKDENIRKKTYTLVNS